MSFIILGIFIIGYTLITLEHKININKSATALVAGASCWTLIMISRPDKTVVLHELNEHFGSISEILFFLLGAMTIVELIDAHEGFQIIIDKIKTKNYKKLIWTIALITFFLSSILDNLTTTIVMVSLLRKIIPSKDKKLLFVGIVVIAANAGGAWSPIGDVTTTMLWIGKQISAGNIIQQLFLPSLICLLVPLLVISRKIKGEIAPVQNSAKQARSDTTDFEKSFVLRLGVGVLIFVPFFKTITHLPPYLVMLLGLGIMWIVIEFVHNGKNSAEKSTLTVASALRKIDTPSVLFFLGILLSVAALETTGQLNKLADFLTKNIANEAVTVMIIGLLSAIVDNVPIVAAVQGMYSLSQYPTDHFIWVFLAYATGTGGSALIIGSAAGVTAMGMEKIDFFWYLKKIAWLALLGYFAGAAAYLIQYNLIH
jgi:Na+/H+ antiporter NhaD/arsenite permease-like protein